MKTDTIYVINPNSSTAVTAGVDSAIELFRGRSPYRLTCLTLESGPTGIVSQLDADSVVPGLLDLARQVEHQAAAVVIACFSDPGLRALRETLACPVLGIGESAVLTALTLGERFGVIATMPASVARHVRTWRGMGVQGRFAGEIASGLRPEETVDAEKSLHRLLAVGLQLRDLHGADVIVLGCAGMAAQREALEAALGVPVVEPSQAATAMAIGQALLGRRKAAPAHP